MTQPDCKLDLQPRLRSVVHKVNIGCTPDCEPHLRPDYKYGEHRIYDQTFSNFKGKAI